MRRTLKIVSFIVATIAIIYGCDSGGSNELNPQITGIQPESGPPGTAVTISGNDFSPTPSENNVTFDGTSASVNNATETELETEVPEGIEPGEAEIEVSVDGNTAFGPSFTVEKVLKNKIVYVKENSRVYIMNPDGSEKEFLFEKQVLNSIDVSPSGGKFVYSTGGLLSSDLFVSYIDGTGEVQLTTSANGNTRPNWSPDGKQIVFSRGNDSGTFDEFETYIINSDGSDLRQVTDTDSGAFRPDWSLDGSHIIYASEVGNDKSEIFRVNPDGSNRQQITDEGFYALNSHYSPDGDKIVFNAYNDNDNYEIYKINADGSGLTNLTNTPNKNDYVPYWSPDGLEIIFTQSSTEIAFFQVYKMNFDGTNVQQLTSDNSDNTPAGWASEE